MIPQQHAHEVAKVCRSCGFCSPSYGDIVFKRSPEESVAEGTEPMYPQHHHIDAQEGTLQFNRQDPAIRQNRRMQEKIEPLGRESGRWPEPVAKLLKAGFAGAVPDLNLAATKLLMADVNNPDDWHIH